ncbi:hypothetical protein MCOR08_000639 [Pyricularia oryzae]|nr:hypothetical protein MCOR08_000639 [Pyricularia oryzae]
MSPATRREFLQAVHKGLHDVPYVVIGGSALAEYGSGRETGDVDVLVGSGCSKRSAESLLIKRTEGRLVRVGHGKIIFRASDGNIYPLDLSEDHEVDLKFEQARDTASLKNSPGYKLANFVFLLNSKAHAWQTRVPFEPKFHEKNVEMTPKTSSSVWNDSAADVTLTAQNFRGSTPTSFGPNSWRAARELVNSSPPPGSGPTRLSL